MEVSILVAVIIFGTSIFFLIWLKRQTEKSKREKEQPAANAKNSRVNTIQNRFDKNAWERIFLDDNRIRKVTANLHVIYENDEEELSEKIVRVREVDRFLQQGIFHGFCEGSQRSAIFKYDSIHQCTDLDTGETIDDVQQYLLHKYEDSAEKTLDLLFYKYIDVLKVLFFIGRENDRFDRKQAEIVREYLCIFSDDIRLSLEQIDALFFELATPTLQACKQAINRADSYEDVDLKDLYLCCRALSQEQEKLEPQKQELLRYLEERKEKNWPLQTLTQRKTKNVMPQEEIAESPGDKKVEEFSCQSP